MEKITDRKAVLIALRTAIDCDLELIAAHSHLREYQAVKDANRRIVAYRRVIERYFDGARPLSFSEIWNEGGEEAKTISIYDIGGLA